MEVWGGSQLTDHSVAFGGLDTWVYSKPYGDAEHGGDVYYASSCATGRISRLLLADVAGHGDAVAKTALDLRTLMRRFVNRLDQSEFVRLLNAQFAEESRAGVFATAVVTTFFAPSRRLTLCNAGHPRPLLFRQAEGRWRLLTSKAESTAVGPSNLPLGLLSITAYEHFDVELQSGDCLLLYTDALMESNDADGEMLGERGLLKIIRALPQLEPPQLTQAFLAEVGRLYPENLTDDDVTVMLLRANGGEAHYSLREKVSAAGRFAGSLLQSFQSNAERAPFPDATLPNLGGAVIPALGRRWRAKSDGL